MISISPLYGQFGPSVQTVDYTRSVFVQNAGVQFHVQAGQLPHTPAGECLKSPMKSPCVQDFFVDILTLGRPAVCVEAIRLVKSEPIYTGCPSVALIIPASWAEDRL